MLRQYQRDIFPIDESPARVAGSVFAGAFIGVMPTLGVALPLTWLATSVLKLPKGPGMVASFIATPPTLFFFFYPLGYFAVGLPIVQPPSIDFDFLSTIASLNLRNTAEVGAELWQTAQGHVLAFVVGMSIVALVTAALCAWVAFSVMQRKRRQASF